MKRLFDILARMRRLSLILFLIPSALYLSAEGPTQHPFTINASGAQVTIETGTYEHTWNDVSANYDDFLTKAEWEYLLENHSWRFIQRTAGTIPSVYCIVIYPDDYEETIYGSETNYTGVEVDDDTCSELEEAGARFLFYKHAGVVRGYWTTTAADATNGYYVLFHPNASPVVTCGETDAKTSTKYSIRVTRLAPPSCDCFTVTLH